MLANGPRDSSSELRLRRALHARGLRYRLHAKISAAPRAVRADVYFPRQRVAVFVDGCFWHVCPRHATWPKQNAVWWRTKLLANAARDRKQAAALRGIGMRVVRVWAHEDVDRAAKRIEGIILARRAAGWRRAG